MWFIKVWNAAGALVSLKDIDSKFIEALMSFKGSFWNTSKSLLALRDLTRILENSEENSREQGRI